ncbi:HAD family hydrolase [bacterium]|jgi:D-glycero-D-manno-heptose 1,7-bisphosphate phosphatase|nr:HAD family hydrolase [bacterium]
MSTPSNNLISSTKPLASRPVVFLDRDGTLNVEAGYIKEVDNLNLIEGAGEAIAKLNRADVACVLVTNQTGAARGYYPESHINALHDRLVSLLALSGAHLDAIYYCPHLSREEGGAVAPYDIACNCRKPGTGLVEQAYLEHPQLSRQLAFVVGDKATDVELAANCNVKGVLVETGFGKDVQSGAYQWPVKPDFQACSIVEAAEWILASISKLN